jgi:hypothetical protein
MFSPKLAEKVAHGQPGVAAADDDCLYLFNVAIHKTPRIISGQFGLLAHAT